MFYDMSLSELCQIFLPRADRQVILTPAPSSKGMPYARARLALAVAAAARGNRFARMGRERGREREREVTVSDGGGRILAVAHLSVRRVDEQSRQDAQKDASSPRRRDRAVIWNVALLGPWPNQLRDVVQLLVNVQLQTIGVHI